MGGSLYVTVLRARLDVRSVYLGKRIPQGVLRARLNVRPVYLSKRIPQGLFGCMGVLAARPFCECGYMFGQ